MRAGVSKINPNPFTTRPEIEGTFGVVAATHWIATAVGMATLEKGGNAFDAAVATAFVLQVVEPHLNGPGGDVPVILHDVKRGKPEVICGQGPAPAAATIARFTELGLDIVPGTGLLAACVPGMFDTWMLLLREYGTMRPSDVLTPAISYARNGHPIVERASATIATVEDLFRDHWPTSAAVYLPDGNVPPPGSMFANQTLADTYERILREAVDAGGDRVKQIERARLVWSQGFVAEAIDRFSRMQKVMDVTGTPHGGLLTGADMARWQAHVEAPLTYDYGRYTVCKAGVWSQGPVMLQQLALLRGYDLDCMDPTGPQFIHLQVECAKLAFADREAFYGDPDFVKVPIDTLLSEKYNAERRQLISNKASMELRPGSLAGFGGAIQIRREEGPRAAVGALGAGEPRVGRVGEVIGDTVHFDIIDQAGNMVSSRRRAVGRSRRLVPDLGLPRHPRADVLARGRSPGLARARQASALDADPDPGTARRRTVSRLGLARRRSAGPVDHAVLPAPPCRNEPAGSHRRTGLAFLALSDLVLAAHLAPGGAGGGIPRAGSDGEGIAQARPRGRSGPGLVGRPADGCLACRQAPPRRRQSAWHAGLCCGALRLHFRHSGSRAVRERTRESRLGSDACRRIRMGCSTVRSERASRMTTKVIQP
jgi:gamma-glutamyltranspeptidase/glutathione hydrolase